jgi:prepilin-type N-terminal cleavage/methylation domain-containing protein
LDKNSTVTPPSQHGFTLVELSIVLVVIGLLVGGILVGRDLIHAAELRSITSDVDKFKTAVNIFKMKYNCIPGDCANATDFLGTDPGGCPNTPSNTVPKTTTCNGDGMDDIGSYYSATFSNYPEEEFRFWQQLASVGLIAGAYTGATASGSVYTENAVLGLNIPAAKVSGSGWVVHYWSHSDFIDGSSPLDNEYANKTYYHLVGVKSTGDWFKDAAISPQDALNVDSKIDDGEPYTGHVFAFDLIYLGNPNGCVTNSFSIPSEYVATSSAINKCSLAFAAEF